MVAVKKARSQSQSQTQPQTQPRKMRDIFADLGNSLESFRVAEPEVLRHAIRSSPVNNSAIGRDIEKIFKALAAELEAGRPLKPYELLYSLDTKDVTNPAVQALVQGPGRVRDLYGALRRLCNERAVKYNIPRKYIKVRDKRYIIIAGPEL